MVLATKTLRVPRKCVAIPDYPNFGIDSLGGFVLVGTSASASEPLSRTRVPRTGSRHSHCEVLIVAGTRPECIKLAPVVQEFARRGRTSTRVANSGQHPDAVRRTFAEFDIACDIELPALPPLPNLGAASRQLVTQLGDLIARTRPSLVLVQGDTLTAYAGARAGAEARCPVVHVEAGLRAPSVSDPFPEEWFRRRIARHAQFHFAPCDSAYRNLVDEGMPRSRIHQVGNTGIDSLRALVARHAIERAATPSARVLVTLHRRENWDSRAEVICDALIELAHRRPDLRLVVPVHPNPRIAPRLRKRLRDHPQFSLVAPLAYREFITAVADAALVISDSGGIQEEVPHLGVPLLVPRSCTERPEGVATGFVRIVAVDRRAIVDQAIAMLAAPRRPALPFDRKAPFGDGTAAVRVVDVLEAELANAAVVEA